MGSRTQVGPRSTTVSHPAPRGFTLVEVLLAVFLINVGLLALVAASAVLVRQTNDLRARRSALQTGTNRLQLLGAASCAPASGDANGPSGEHEWWSIEPIEHGVRELRDSIAFFSRGEARSFILRTRLPC